MRMSLAVVSAVLIVLMAGCGGGGQEAVVGPPPADNGGSDILEIGPLVVQTAKTGNFKAVDIPSQYGCSFVALYGAQINYLASTALLDRVVFASNRSGTYNIYVCNLDGSAASLVQLTNNSADERWPRWSPDGTKIAFSRQWPGQKTVICTMNADGTGVTALTSSAQENREPEWSPEGGRIAYTNFSGGVYDVCTMNSDGAHQTNVTAAAGSWDENPAWSPDGRTIAFVTSRYGGATELAYIGAYGGIVTRITNDTFIDAGPAFNPQYSSLLAYTSVRGSNLDVFSIYSSGGGETNVTSHSAYDYAPRWSSDGQMMAFVSTRSGSDDVWIRGVDPPYLQWQVTKHSAGDIYPDLGSPTMQTERVLIGAPGADRGFDPVYPSAPAVIAAFNQQGYRNLVRIGVAAGDLPSLKVRPLVATAANGFAMPAPPGVEVSATKVANLRQDAGWGKPPTLWDFNALNAGMVLLYFNTETGKLLSAVPVKDSAYSASVESGAGAPYEISAAGEGVKLSGAFSGAFDAEGRNLAPGGASSVTLGRDGEVVAVN